MRVNAAVGRRGVKGLRGKGRILFGKAKCGIRNLRKEKAEKRSRFADLA